MRKVEVGAAAVAVVTSLMYISFSYFSSKGYLHDIAYDQPKGHMPGEYKFTALTRSLTITLVVGSWTEPGVDKLASDSINVEVTPIEVSDTDCEGG